MLLDGFVLGVGIFLIVIVIVSMIGLIKIDYQRKNSSSSKSIDMGYY